LQNVQKETFIDGNSVLNGNEEKRVRKITGLNH